MKKTLITFAIFLMGTGTWAQSIKAEEAAIKKVLEKETEAVINRDYEQWIECFANSPDLAFGFSSILPTYMVRNYDKLAKFGKNFFKNNPEPTQELFEFTDYQIRINGTSAFVTYLQTNTNQDGTKQRYHKAEYLEKIEGEWKMIGHIFGQEPEPATSEEK